jgi:hypothetical protein
LKVAIFISSPVKIYVLDSKISLQAVGAQDFGGLWRNNYCSNIS